MKIKNIVFDLGGVLVDWNPRYLYRDIFEDEQEMEYFLENICSHEWNIQQDAGRPFEDAIELLQSKYPTYAAEIRLFREEWEKMLGGEIQENVKMIQPLKSKYKVYALTNWSAETYPIAEVRYDFLKEFEGIIVSGIEKMYKPKKNIYKLLLHRFKLKAEECLFIDDNADNIRTADKLGFSTIHFVEGMVLENEINKLNLI
jgi:2-haloacid dehalogenase